MAIDFRLDGKTILVTGASSGIGQAIAIRASEMGAKLILLGRNESRLAETAAACPGETARVLLDFSDASTVDTLPQVVRNIAQKHGTLAGVVHSAGICHPAPLRALRVADMQLGFQINAVAGVMLAKGLAAPGVAVRDASMVFMSSIMGRVGETGLASYCMSKGAVELAVKALAIELTATHIRINAIAPCMVATPMFNRCYAMFSEKERAKLDNSLPNGLGKSDDIAAAAIYLLSDASRFVTGTSLLVDGGYCAR